MLPSSACETASCSIWPVCSGTCDITTIDWPPIEICTWPLPRICCTWALITVPGCRMTSAVTPCTATNGTLGLMTIVDMVWLHRVRPGRSYKAVVNLSLTDAGIQGLENANSGVEIDQPGGAARRDFAVHAP